MSVENKDLNVYATLTEQAALSLGNDNPDLSFTKDTESIIFAGKIYTLNKSQRTWVINKIREEIEQNCSISISINPTSGINGESQSLSIIIKLYYKGALADAVEGSVISNISCKVGSQNISLTQQSVGTYQGSVSLSTPTTITASANMFGVTKEATINYSTYYPSWYGKSTMESVANSSGLIQLKSQLSYITKDLAGSTNTLSLSGNNPWLWVIVPKTTKSISVIDSSTGFGVGMTSIGDFEVTLGTTRATYSIFRSYNGVSALNKVTISFT